MEKGSAGYGLYWLLLELLSTSPDCEFERNYNRVGYALHESAKEIKAVIENYGLFQITDDGKRFYSARMKEQMEAVADIKEKRSVAGKTGRGNPNFQKGKKNPYYQQIGEKEDKQMIISEDKQNGKFDYLEDKQRKGKEIKGDNNASFPNVKEASSVGDATDTAFADEEAVDWGRLVRYWNEATAGRYGRLIDIKNNRRKMVMARIREHGKKVFMLAIDKAAQSNYLAGVKWFNFDWMIRPDNFDKVITGNYDDKNTQGHGDTTDRRGEIADASEFVDRL